MTAPQLLTFLAIFLGVRVAVAQSSDPPSQPTANELVRMTVTNELKQQAADHSHWMFRMQHEEPGKKVVEEIIETSHGNLDRLLERNGRPLTTRSRNTGDFSSLFMILNAWPRKSGSASTMRRRHKHCSKSFPTPCCLSRRVDKVTWST
jgi:hypothetical protein